MREIRIIVTDTAVSFPDGKELGRIGEHNATQLIIELPDDMIADVDYHVIKFSLLSGAITSDIITDDDDAPIYLSGNKIYCTLWQQLTASRGISFTVETYKVIDGTPAMIKKSPLVSGLRFDPSTDAGAEVDEQGYSLAAHVANLDDRVEDKVDKVTGMGLSTNDLTDELKLGYDAAANDRHSHANKSTLDKFSSLEEILPTYNERIIPTMTTNTDYDDGNIVVIKATGLLETAENSEGEPLNVSDIVGAIDKAHEHENIIPISKLTEDADGNPLYGGKPIGGVTVVDSYTDLPADAAEGELAYVRLETESDDGAPLDLSDCPKSSDVYAEIEAAYTAQGGTVGDAGYSDFRDNYTNCDFSAGALKLGVPIYRPVADIDAFFYVALSLGTTYGERELLWVRPILFLVGSEVLQSEYAVFVPDSDYNYGYMSGCAYNTEANGPEEFTENGITKYIIKLATVYAFENLSGQLHNTGGMFDGFQLNLALGWNSVSLILVLDEGTGDLVAERAEIVSLNDTYLPECTFWRLTDIDDEDGEAFARAAIPDMITDTTQSITIPPALYIRADGEWRKTS